jgi:hypothetical protein
MKIVGHGHLLVIRSWGGSLECSKLESRGPDLKSFLHDNYEVHVQLYCVTTRQTGVFWTHVGESFVQQVENIKKKKNHALF